MAPPQPSVSVSVSPTGPGNTGNLPVTGPDVVVLMVVALLVLIAGVALVRGAARRRRA